jgi:DNA-binding response OmpR family regulator
VDDENDITSMLAKGLERHGGFLVASFNDPLLALQNFKPDYYDLLILDVKMPNMGGIELYRRLKAASSGKSKVLFFTAYDSGDEEIRKIFPELGKNNFIRKPARIIELIDRVKSLIVS